MATPALPARRQAFSPEQVFLTMGLTFAAALPLLLLFRTGRVRGGGAAH